VEMHPFFQVLDPYLIWFYRLTGHAGVDFVIGTLVLAGLALLMGEITVSLVFRCIRPHLEQRAEEAAKYQDLSLDALKAGNREAYQAANKLASDAFGHSFFQQLTLSAAFLCPVFFALAWMQPRFLELEFPLPLIGVSLGYIGVFILIYVAAYVLFKKGRKGLGRWRCLKKIPEGPSFEPREGKV